MDEPPVFPPFPHSSFFPRTIEGFRMKRALTAAIGSLLAGLSTGAAAQDDADWKLTPYIWATTITTDIRVPPIETDSAFDDIIDKIDGAFLGHLEWQGDQWGMFGDLIWLSLGDEKEFERISTQSDFDTF